jgi:hypothetical protein
VSREKMAATLDMPPMLYNGVETESTSRLCIRRERFRANCPTIFQRNDYSIRPSRDHPDAGFIPIASGFFMF